MLIAIQYFVIVILDFNVDFIWLNLNAGYYLTWLRDFFFQFSCMCYLLHLGLREVSRLSDNSLSFGYLVILCLQCPFQYSKILPFWGWHICHCCLVTPGSDKMSSWAWLGFYSLFFVRGWGLALPMKPVRSLVSRDLEAEQILRIRRMHRPLTVTTLAALELLLASPLFRPQHPRVSLVLFSECGTFSP